MRRLEKYFNPRIVPFKVMLRSIIIEPEIGLLSSQVVLGPIEMVVLQGTSSCNLNCSYCYLSETSRRTKSRMSLETLKQICTKIFRSPYLGKRLQFTWHAGEPMVLGTQYYREAIKTILATRDALVGDEVYVDFAMQTNGTLLSKDWCDLIKDLDGRLSIGISCDGPPELHNLHRKGWTGAGSHSKTETGMRLLMEHDIQFNVIAVVAPAALKYPVEFINYFSAFASHIKEFHFNPLDQFPLDVDDEWSEKLARDYASFLAGLLDYLKSHPAGTVPLIRNFSTIYNQIFEESSARGDYDARSMSQPFKTLSVEADGTVTTFYAGLTRDETRDLNDVYGDGKGFTIGNLLESDLTEIAASAKLKTMFRDFEISHQTCQRSCDYFDVCSGGYSVVKYRRFGRFDQSETPECRVHVKTLVDTLLADIQQHSAPVS